MRHICIYLCISNVIYLKFWNNLETITNLQKTWKQSTNNLLFLSLLRVSYPNVPPSSLTIFRVYLYNKEVLLGNHPNQPTSTYRIHPGIGSSDSVQGSPGVSVMPCSKDSFQDEVLHLVACLFISFDLEQSLVFPRLCDSDTLEDNKPFVSRSVLQSGFVCLLIIGLRFCPSQEYCCDLVVCYQVAHSSSLFHN